MDTTVSLEHLEKQLTSCMNDMDNARAIFHRAEGMVILLQHMIKEAQDPASDEVLDIVPST